MRLEATAIANAYDFGDRATVVARASWVGGDFFSELPSAGDVYPVSGFALIRVLETKTPISILEAQVKS